MKKSYNKASNEIMRNQTIVKTENIKNVIFENFRHSKITENTHQPKSSKH
jgi:hypothetical protein